MYDFIKMMYDAGCDIKQYLNIGIITQSEYDQLIGGQDGAI